MGSREDTCDHAGGGTRESHPLSVIKGHSVALFLGSWLWHESGCVDTHPLWRRVWARTSPPPPLSVVWLPSVVKWARSSFGLPHLCFCMHPPTPTPSYLIPNSSVTMFPLETAQLVHKAVSVTEKVRSTTSPRDTCTSAPSQV